MMICPQCQGEYRDGFTQCADCFVNLVVAPPPETRAPVVHDVELVTVFESGNPSLAAVASTLLNAAGIEFATRGEALQELFGVARFPASMNLIAGPVEFQVARTDAEDARTLLLDLVPALQPESDTGHAGEDGPPPANDPGLDPVRLDGFGRRYAAA